MMGVVLFFNNLLIARLLSFPLLCGNKWVDIAHHQMSYDSIHIPMAIATFL